MFCYLSLEIVPLKLSVDKKCTYTFSITIFKEVFINLLSTSKLLSFVEEHNALQWTFSVFFFFFSITFQGLQNSWSLKSAQYDGLKRWIQLFFWVDILTSIRPMTLKFGKHVHLEELTYLRIIEQVLETPLR